MAFRGVSFILVVPFSLPPSKGLFSFNSPAGQQGQGTAAKRHQIVVSLELARSPYIASRLPHGRGMGTLFMVSNIISVLSALLVCHDCLRSASQR